MDNAAGGKAVLDDVKRNQHARTSAPVKDGRGSRQEWLDVQERGFRQPLSSFKLHSTTSCAGMDCIRSWSICARGDERERGCDMPVLRNVHSGA